MSNDSYVFSIWLRKNNRPANRLGKGGITYSRPYYTYDNNGLIHVEWDNFDNIFRGFGGHLYKETK